MLLTDLIHAKKVFPLITAKVQPQLQDVLAVCERIYFGVEDDPKELIHALGNLILVLDPLDELALSLEGSLNKKDG